MMETAAERIDRNESVRGTNARMQNVDAIGCWISDAQMSMLPPHGISGETDPKDEWMNISIIPISLRVCGGRVISNF